MDSRYSSISKRSSDLDDDEPHIKKMKKKKPIINMDKEFEAAAKKTEENSIA